MTRRHVVFYDPDKNKLHMTPEFNGDKSEFALIGAGTDSCDKDWDEIIQCFQNVKTLSQFKEANRMAQSFYRSFLGDEELPVEVVDTLAASCDERVYLCAYAMKKYFYLLYKLDWAKSRGYNIEDYDDEHGFNGESWVCFEEFLDSEFQDEECMRYLLDDKDFILWSEHQNKNN